MLLQTEHPNLCLANYPEPIGPGRWRMAWRAQWWIDGNPHPFFGPECRSEQAARDSVADRFPIGTVPASFAGMDAADADEWRYSEPMR